MTEDLSHIFTECEAYLRTALSRWRKNMPVEMYEDAFQEGMIQCWRDVEAGVTPKLKILRRSSLAANKFFHRNGEYYFGRSPKSRDGLRANTKTVEKVKQFVEEYTKLHNEWPGPVKISNALGISDSSASKMLKDIREGRVDHMVYREDGRMDWNYYSTISVEMLATNNSEGQEVRNWTDDSRIPSETWEDAVASDMDMQNLLSKMSPKHRAVLYMHFFLGNSATEIGEWAGHTTHVSAKGARHISNAISQARMILSPYEGECTKGHERSETNTLVGQRKDGVWFRSCRVCHKAGAEVTNEKVKREGRRTGRKRTPTCLRGHVKDMTDSRGSARCRECRAAAQKRYMERRKAQRESS